MQTVVSLISYRTIETCIKKKNGQPLHIEWPSQGWPIKQVSDCIANFSIPSNFVGLKNVCCSYLYSSDLYLKFLPSVKLTRLAHHHRPWAFASWFYVKVWRGGGAWLVNTARNDWCIVESWKKLKYINRQTHHVSTHRLVDRVFIVICWLAERSHVLNSLLVAVITSLRERVFISCGIVLIWSITTETVKAQRWLLRPS